LVGILSCCSGIQVAGRGIWQAMARTNPASSRAIAVVTVVAGFPARLKLFVSAAQQHLRFPGSVADRFWPDFPVVASVPD